MAPQPGVIPLRPLDLGAILSGAVGYIRANPLVTLGVSAVIVTLTQVVAVIGQLVVFRSILSVRSARDLADAAVASLGSVAVIAIVAVPASALLTGMLIVVLSRAVLGRRASFGETWSAVAPRLGGLVGVSLLAALIIAGIAFVAVLPLIIAAVTQAGAGAVVPAILFMIAGFALMIYVAVSLTMAAPAYVLEDVGVVAALSRSRSLVQGTWWRVFGILLLAGLMAGVVNAIVGIPFGVGFGSGLNQPSAALTTAFLIKTAIGAIIAGTFTAPFTAGVTGLLYIDQRMRKEGFADDLARAAATGPPSPGP